MSEPSERTIRNWVKQADLNDGLRGDDLTTEERKEPRELKRLRMEHDIPKVPSGLDCKGERIDPRRGYACMKANLAEFPLAAMCRALGFSIRGSSWLAAPSALGALERRTSKPRLAPDLVNHDSSARPHRGRGMEGRTPYKVFKAGIPQKVRTRKPSARKEVKTAA